MTKQERLEKYIREHPYWKEEEIASFLEKESRREEAMREKSEKALVMLTMYRKGFTLQEIGDVYRCTRENVRRMMVEVFGKGVVSEAVAESRQLRKERYYKALDNIYLECQECKKEYKPANPLNRKRKYCSKECFQKSKRVIEYPDWVAGRPIQQKYYNAEEWKELNRIRVNSYYRRHREEMNAKQRERYKTNSARQMLYTKRCIERAKYGHAITPLPDVKNPYAVKK